jgi:hypothetical protein
MSFDRLGVRCIMELPLENSEAGPSVQTA